MLDLTRLNDITFDIKLNDELIVNIKKPNNAMYNELFGLVRLIEKDNANIEGLTNATYEFLTGMVNRNKQNQTFTRQEVEEYFPLDVAMYVIKEYQAWGNKSVEALRDGNF